MPQLHGEIVSPVSAGAEALQAVLHRFATMRSVLSKHGHQIIMVPTDLIITTAGGRPFDSDSMFDVLKVRTA